MVVECIEGDAELVECLEVDTYIKLVRLLVGKVAYAELCILHTCRRYRSVSAVAEEEGIACTPEVLVEIYGVVGTTGDTV